MKANLRLVLILQVVLVLSLVVAVRTRVLPVGVPGEWLWNRIQPGIGLSGEWLLLAGFGVAAYAGFIALGMRVLAAPRSRRLEAVLLLALFVAAVAAQVIVTSGAPAGYDLAKWAAVNYLPSSSGYFQIARKQAIRDPWQFMADYPAWIKSQDSMHIGTHPPGLILAQCLLMRTFQQNPALAGFLVGHMPAPLRAGFRAFSIEERAPFSRVDTATLYATGLATLLACAATVVPLYLLARVALPASAAWAAAALWPLAPAAVMFQPVADTAYPLLSTSALALAAWAARLAARPRRPTLIALGLAALSGTIMALGMLFTLAFLPVGLIAALVVILSRDAPWPVRALLILVIGAGFLSLLLAGWAASGANPFVIAAWNLHHHARFYVQHPRTYHVWLLVNPIELVIALGLPAAVLGGLALLAPRSLPLSFWATLIVLALVNLTGRNLGEVARLWMLFMPPLLLAAGAGCMRLRTPAAGLAGSIALLGAQTLALQSMIQGVYPV